MFNKIANSPDSLQTKDLDPRLEALLGIGWPEAVHGILSVV